MAELRRSDLAYEHIKRLSVEYMGKVLGVQDSQLIMIENKVLLAAFASRQVDSIMKEFLKARMRRLEINVGLLANFHNTQLSITPVRIK